MSDEIDSNKEYISVAKEVSKGIQWLPNKRKLLRDVFFNNKLTPLYNEMETNHNDFRLILHELRELGQRLSREITLQGNDIDNYGREYSDIFKNVQSARMTHQSNRPAIRATAYQALKEIESSYANDINVILSEDEKKHANNLFSSIYQYLTINDMYAHDLAHHIKAMERTVYNISKNGITKENKKQLEKATMQVAQYKQNRELAWREIAEPFGALKNNLS